MMKRLCAAALVFAAVLLCACGNQNEPEATPSPTPDPLTVLRDEIAAYADAEVSEAEGALLVTLSVTGADEAQACAAFFDLAETVWTNCLRDQEYDGVSFTMRSGGEDVGDFYVMVREAGMVPMPPTAYDADYAQALEDAFMDSAFAFGVEG